ncbi:GNAT family N-acetyltransferase [uncultured Paracoccus sp.]|uniref:GNAT family N-acetyltransferase n=1 Tax=uncultured Paracoccus sp. TaxID=189685 RepID=UPI0025DB2E19|nr:GNAT family N-acetyltransferase [uncultured Paracoccus sp.]
MTPDRLARIHAACFRDAPRPWSADEIAGLLEGRGCFLLTRPDAFLIGRAIAGESELLTLAVAPGARRRGLGRALVAEFALRSAEMDADRAFLEVASDNAPAQALYLAQGWRQAGRRRDYYAPGVDALVMSLPLGHVKFG